MKASRTDVLGYRVTAQAGQAILDLGVQNTGPDGAAWALALRGLSLDDLLLAWTLRGAPHFYRRSEIAGVAAATAPYSEGDAFKRIFDASKPLREAGVPALDALATIATEMRSIVNRPMSKGDLSSELSRRLPEQPYLRWCRVCQATHLYEQSFRLSALQAGLELQPGTSPPVLTRIKGWRGRATRVPEHLDVVRGYLRLFGPATPAQVASYVDAPVKDVKEHWPRDAVPVSVEGESRWALPDFTPAGPDRAVTLLGPFDLYLQGKDRELLVPDASHRKELWVMLGRPGGIRRGAEIVGTWRPRAKGKRLQLAVTPWRRVPKSQLEEQGERLAAFRGVDFAGLVNQT